MFETDFRIPTVPCLRGGDTRGIPYLMVLLIPFNYPVKDFGYFLKLTGIERKMIMPEQILFGRVCHMKERSVVGIDKGDDLSLISIHHDIPNFRGA